MAESIRETNFSVSRIISALAMVLSFPCLTLLLVLQGQKVPTYDDVRKEQRLEILADLNAENQKNLTQYHWVDKSKGVVGIPIDFAMQLALVDLQASKPHAAGPIVTPTPANNAQSPSSSPSQAQGQSPNEPQGALGGGDPKAGKVIFLQCAACHSLESDVNKQGPSLAGLFGRKAGSVEDFNYSDSNKNSGIVWGESVLRKYLADPQSVVPGTKMTFPGLKDPKQIEDVIAYLKEATKPQ